MKKESFMNQEFVIDEEMLKKNISLTSKFIVLCFC